mgnify:CR=1 FL=1
MFTLGMALSVVAQGQSQNLVASPWRMNLGEGPQNLKKRQAFTGDPNAYSVMQIPPSSDGGWTPAKVVNGKARNSDTRSKLGGCGDQADFTFFETKVTVPANVVIKSVTVTYERADDGARIYVFNKDSPAGGAFDPKADLNQNTKAAVQFDVTKLLRVGENRIVIAQFDDCKVLNNIEGISIALNGVPIIMPLSEWQMIRGTALGSLPQGYDQNKPNNNSLVLAGTKASTPPETANWGPAPMKGDNLNFDEPSQFKDCNKRLALTYFQTFAEINAVNKVAEIRVEAGYVDDYARVFVNGNFDETKDFKPAFRTGKIDLPKTYLKNGRNRIVIALVDDCRAFSKLTDARVEIVPTQ